MNATIAVIAAGAMGSAVARRLTEHGARVVTLLEGRSAKTAARATAAGMIAVDADEVAKAAIILSIVPPAEAIGLAERLEQPIRRSQHKPIFVDCNAINLTTVGNVGAIIARCGAQFVDGAIIGRPPVTGGEGPTFYFAGGAATYLSDLGELGLKVRLVDGPVGAASALKMSYAGIGKGLTALGAAMILAATRAGAASDLHRELGESLQSVLSRFETAIPDMYPKAYRWVAEMEEIAGFLEEDEAAAMMFRGAARFYERLAADAAGDQQECNALDAFLKRSIA